jgi:MFS family permease
MTERLGARPRRILPIIVLSQFAGTSLWFAGNAIVTELQSKWNVGAQALGYVTSAVQLGFILGTLLFAFFAIADRYSPGKVFLLCSLAGAAANAGVLAFGGSYPGMLALRFVTGFFLAGIYPVGMKIAAGWYQRDLGNAIGFLVGALAIGTAFPHLLKSLGHALSWESVTTGVSLTAAVGGVLMFLFVPDGPHLSRGAKFDPRAIAIIFRSPLFRASAFGYFGHMWELYAFWAFAPVVLAAHFAQANAELNVPFWAFMVIAAGSIGCIAGGLISVRVGSARVAFTQLATSGACCILSPLFFRAPTPLFLAFMLVWGITVLGDSPQFSALNAQNAPRKLVGSALTIGNCIGFSITIVSIQLLNQLSSVVSAAYLYVALAIGPLLGLLALMPLVRPLASETSER